MTVEVSGTASWFDHVKRVEGALWFTLSEKEMSQETQGSPIGPTEEKGSDSTTSELRSDKLQNDESEGWR